MKVACEGARGRALNVRTPVCDTRNVRWCTELVVPGVGQGLGYRYITVHDGDGAGMGKHNEDEARAATQQSGDVPPASSRERTASQPGALLAGRYRVLRTIAAGGMGTVYEGEHTLLGHRVAIKMLHPQYAHSEASTKRFMNEARAAAQLKHPNVARCDDIGVTPDGHPFLVLELLEGRDLADELNHVGPVSLERTMGVARQVASALGYAHSQGVVHRDLKPENVFLARTANGSEQVKVLDFGVARFIGLEHTSGTRTGAAIGTPLYMAPEQFTDASRVDARADVYGLGVMLFEMLTGQRPYEGGTLPELLSRMGAGNFSRLDQLRPDVPAHVVAAIHASLSPHPHERPASMAEFLAVLEGQAPAPEPRPAAVAPVTVRVPEPRRRVARTAAVALVLLVCAGLGALLWLRGASDERVVPEVRVEAKPAPAAPAATAPPAAQPEAPAVVAPAQPEPTPAVEPAVEEASDVERRRARRRRPATKREHGIAEEPDF
jgi:tRNA A-37 threonylcarbamoyl transferase component Bud32